MKFIINQKVLLQNLKKVNRAIDRKSTIPILQGVKLDVNKSGITLVGGNSNIFIVSSISADDKQADFQTDGKGKMVLKAKFFTKVVKSLPSGNLHIKFDPQKFTVLIQSKHSQFTIHGLDANNYPRLPVFHKDSSQSLTLGGNVLLQTIKNTAFSASQEESRPLLTGVQFILKNGVLTANATDAHRLSHYQLKVDAKGSFNVTIPAKCLAELKRLMNSKNQVKILFTGNQIIFKFSNTVFYSRLLVGDYPDVSQLTPKTDSTLLQVKASDLRKVVARASLISHASRNNVVKLSMEPAAHTANLLGDSPDIGETNEQVSFLKLSGKDLVLSFNPDYMLDALKVLGNTVVNIKFLSPLRPFTIVPAKQAQNQFIQLITPIRTF